MPELNEEWVVVRICNWLHEADLVKSILEGHSLEVLLPDEHFLGVQPHYANAIGGAKVMVRLADFDQARAILDAAEALKADSEHPGDNEARLTSRCQPI